MGIDEPEGSDFFRLGDEGHDGPVVSRDAFQLHSFAIVNSVREGTPGFVSDDYLNAISAETTSPAAELCLVGLWERVEDGYSIHDPMVDEAVRFDDKMHQDAEFCTASGGHEPDQENPELCMKCHAPLR